MVQVSIIIPFQKWNSYLEETLTHLERLRGPSFEVMLLPDGHLPEGATARWSGLDIQVLPTGPVSPAIKRDMGAEKTSAPIVAFIDDDAYPTPDWLEKAVPLLTHPGVCGVGGPQVTPGDDTFWQKVSGATFLSVLNGGLVARYWPTPGAPREVDDWPSVNLLVKREDFLAVGGFDSAYWPGEDTKLCRDLVCNLGKKILYCPEAVVFHHRRSGFRRHLRQIGNYALHRGFFSKKFPETSFRPLYLVPTAFTLFLVLGAVLAQLSPILAKLYALGLAMYALALAISTWSIWQKLRDWSVAVATIPYIFGTHIWYGIRFFYGLVVIQNLQSRLGR